MPEEVLFESESRRARADVASYLRTVAENLEGGEPITLRSGSDSVTLDPPARPTFEVKAEREGPARARRPDARRSRHSFHPGFRPRGQRVTEST